jgi:ADP-ribosylglycohydrolase
MMPVRGEVAVFGAIYGDIIGSAYEFHPIKSKSFPLISAESCITDDSVMTVAVAHGLVEGARDPRKTQDCIQKNMQRLGREFPDAGYGGRFAKWLQQSDPEPYNSFGNGSAMRVSPVAWYFDTLEEVERFAAISAGITHNHPEGIKGAQATAAAIFMARQGATMEQIKGYVEQHYGYDLGRSLSSIRPLYSFDVSCQGSVPEAMICFLESTGLEDAIRNAVSLGGDADTQGAIAGSIAEAFYGLSDVARDTVLRYTGNAGLDLSFWAYGDGA